MHHDRWLLSPAEAEVELSSIAPFALGGEPRCCHFAFRQDALIWPPEPIASDLSPLYASGVEPQRKAALWSVFAAVALIALKLGTGSRDPQPRPRLRGGRTRARISSRRC